MTYYAKSVFYPIVGDSREKIVRFSAKLIRRSSFLVNGTLLFVLPDGELPRDATIVLLDDREHVLTIDPSTERVQFSVNYKEIADECHRQGWLQTWTS